MPQSRKYTVKKFQQAVDKYFRSRMTLRATGHEDIDGNPITYFDFAIPPSKADICIDLGISRDTWAEYSKLPGYKDVCDRASTLIESWLARELNSRERVDGVKFNLSCNYGWTPAEKREVELGEETRKTVEAASISMDDKLALISSVFGQISAAKDAHGAADEPVSYSLSGDNDGRLPEDVDNHSLGGVGYYDDEDNPHGAVDHSSRAEPARSDDDS